MTDTDRRAAAARFAAYWKGRGYEKGESQTFWLTLLTDVLGVENVADFITFEEQVKLDHTSFIDGFIPATHVLIEQKSVDKDLRKPIRQSDGTLLTPFQQAKRYSAELPYSQRPRWIVTCNFQAFDIYDMERPTGEPERILLEDLATEYYRLRFLVNAADENIKKEMELSLQAGQIVGALYDALLAQYNDPASQETLRSLNALCVRLVFCLYAEDAGIFGRHGMFHDYLRGYAVRDVRGALIELFKVLDTPPAERDPYSDEELLAFPYVNGGLFSDENVVIPRITPQIVDLLLRRASEDFDWSSISPTIFGAVFESTLNPETRRSGGMHYTSLENIHKVIDPLFLDDLKQEYAQIEAIPVEKTRMARLKAFQAKLASLTFLDPACGSGNFLTETYLSLRRLENQVIAELWQGQVVLGEVKQPIQVSIGQFYGVEINDFAVTVAKTALWIAESQMMKATEDVVHMPLDFLPLKTNAHIVEGNALRLDWESVVPKNELSYIMGNPPFVGHQNRNEMQIEDMQIAFADLEKHGKLDYVCGWYSKAVTYMQGTVISAAFVSTNSIVQGESVGILWKYLFSKGVEIQFAHRAFIWTSESKNHAAVHCVIIGFTCFKKGVVKRLYDSNRFIEVDHINGYLLSAPDVFIQSRGKPLKKDMPAMSKGSQPTDGGNLILSEEERDLLLSKHPEASEFVLQYISADDYINNKKRYCLWLNGISPAKYRKIPFVMERLNRVVEMRSKSPTASVRRDAEKPMLFTQIRQPKSLYLCVPEVSSERRKYVPIGYMPPTVIASNMLYLVPNVSLYSFGVMISNVHMAWMRIVCGRLKSDYRYTPAVYNNFPWPEPTEEQKQKIERTAQAILDARALYPDASLADLYDETAMPPELRRAHQANDRAVWDAYGRAWPVGSESACVAYLMKLYQRLTAEP